MCCILKDVQVLISSLHVYVTLLFKSKLKSKTSTSIFFSLPNQHTLLQTNKHTHTHKFSSKMFSAKKKSYWSMITHAIFDWIGNDLQNQVMTYLWFGIRLKHLPVWGWYTLSDFLLFLLNPVFPLNGHLETKC